jgi:hypothetical protein
MNRLLPAGQTAAVRFESKLAQDIDLFPRSPHNLSLFRLFPGYFRKFSESLQDFSPGEGDNNASKINKPSALLFKQAFYHNPEKWKGKTGTGESGCFVLPAACRGRFVFGAGCRQKSERIKMKKITGMRAGEKCRCASEDFSPRGTPPFYRRFRPI